VELDTGEVGLVVNLPADPVHFNRPQVKLLIDRAGQRTDSGEVLSLAQKKTGLVVLCDLLNEPTMHVILGLASPAFSLGQVKSSESGPVEPRRRSLSQH
jgi:hypothetical protein